MKVFAISDLHLSTTVDKPMDIFGPVWQGHFDAIKRDWLARVNEDDVVLLCGDFSWAQRSGQVVQDIALLNELPGKKILLRGNHDYWWNSISQLRAMLPNNIFALQNDSLRIGEYLFFGTRGWTVTDEEGEDKRLYLREIERMKLSIAHMSSQRQPQDKVICLMHFPPFNIQYEQSEFVKMLIAADVHTVVYGHLHGKDCRVDLHLNRYGIDFYLTSCDLTGNKLVNIF